MFDYKLNRLFNGKMRFSNWNDCVPIMIWNFNLENYTNHVHCNKQRMIKVSMLCSILKLFSNLLSVTRNFTYPTLYPKQTCLSYVNITTAIFQTYVSRKSQKNALRHCNYVWKQCCHIINKIWHLHFTHKKIKFDNLELRL